jgi:hypothetical protein
LVVFEPVLDDRAQFYESASLLIEEFMRQQLPQFLSRRLKREIIHTDFENDTGPSDAQGRHRELFSILIPRLANEAVDDVLSALRQRSSVDTCLSNLITTPPLSKGLTPSQTTLHETSQDGNESIHTSAQLLVDLSTPHDSQHIDPRISESELMSTHYQAAKAYPTTHDPGTEGNDAHDFSNAIVQAVEFATSDNTSLQLERNANPRQHDSSLNCQTVFNWEAAFDHLCNNEQGVASGMYDHLFESSLFR